MKKALIIADDFTGANDTGVQFKRNGFPSAVLFPGRPMPEAVSCLVVDTESRAAKEEDAAEAVRRAAESLELDAFDTVIKKVDSTLRGNIAAELRALDEAYRSQLLLFIPALPDLGRTTENGIHRLNGVRITETELARDPKMPVRQDNITDLLKGAFDEPVGHISLKEIRQGRIDFSGCRVFSGDCATNEDMSRLVAAAQAAGRRTLWAGAAALADALVRQSRPPMPAFGIAASLSQVTAGQLSEVKKAGVPVISLPIPAYLSGESHWRGAVEEAVGLLASGKDVLLASCGTLCRDEADRSLEAGRKRGLTPVQTSEYVQTCCGQIGAAILKEIPVSGVFLTGGDTAMGLMKALGAAGSEILSEIAVGIPMMRLVDGAYPGLKLVTKAGAFGGPDAILFALRKLKEAGPR